MPARSRRTSPGPEGPTQAPDALLASLLSPIAAELGEVCNAGFKAAGKKLDMGKACIRFQAAQDLALDVGGDVVGSVPLGQWVEIAKAARRH